MYRKDIKNKKVLIFHLNKFAVVLAFALFIAIATFVGCNSDGEDTQDTVQGLFGTVRVSIADADGITVSSATVQNVDFGGSARFELQIEDGVIIDSVSNGTLEGNQITVSDVYFPVTVRVKTRRLAKCGFMAYSNNAMLGTVQKSIKNGEYWEDTQVTVTANPKKDAMFIGFSVGNTIKNGGELLSTDLTYTHTLKSDVKIYANFDRIPNEDPTGEIDVPKDNWVILYHPNGGVQSSNGSEDYLYSTFSSKYYYCPNTYPSTGLFEREGYVLLGYNTEADGSGTFYAPGWNVIMPESRAISLYCVWEKVSEEFSYSTLSDGTLALTKYNGNADRVVIPEEINGKKVTVIKANSFAGKSIKELVISRTVTKIEDNAFDQCKNLETLYFSDSILSIKDEAFSNCTSLKTIHMMATRFPAYASTRNGTFSIKFEKLITDTKNKMVLVSGSNTSFGVNSETLEKELLDAGYDYAVINYGTIAEECVTFILEVISHFVGEGDVVVHLPEPKTKTQWGASSFSDNYTWTVFECAYDAFSYVDMRHYTDFFDSFATFNQNREKKGSFVSYESYTNDTVNRYGDYAANRASTTSSLKNKFAEYNKNGEGPVSYENVMLFVMENGDKLERVYKLIGNSGATMLNSFAATAKAYLTKESAEAGGAVQKKLESIVDSFSTTRISDISTYVFEDKWFYNSEYHLTSEGAIMRSKLLAKDLVEHFKGSKNQ